MSGPLGDLPGPALSLASGLPGAFFGSALTTSLVESFDQVLAPVITTLDDLDAYLDPRYAPDDNVQWLGGWLNRLVDDRWPADRVRAHLADLREALTSRGTARGLAAGLRACTGNDATVRDNGGVSWSSRPGGALPGQPHQLIEVWVTIDEESVRSLVHAMVADLKPAHMPVRVHVTTPDD